MTQSIKAKIITNHTSCKQSRRHLSSA